MNIFLPLRPLLISILISISGVCMAEVVPVEVKITAPAGRMKYDRSLITAVPGARLRFVFENQDEMPHNIVLCRPHPGKNDKGLEVAQQAWNLGVLGMERDWIPENPRVLVHSGLVAAHGRGEFLFTVPNEPGSYPYVCTFPGHAMLMNGELRVMREGPKLKDLRFQLYSGEWKNLPDFSALTPLREGPAPDNLIDIKLEGMAEHFGLRFTGTLEAPEDGDYLFFLASDDGSKLYIDDSQVIEYDGIHPSNSLRSGRAHLKRGPHAFRLDYFENAGQEELFVSWRGLKFDETILSRWIHPSRRGDEVSKTDEKLTDIPLKPENGEPVIYRNFIEGCGPRGIAVGYPNGANLCFDAGQLSVPLLWRGAFMDAKRHWTDRGSGNQPPLGYDILKPAPEGPSLAVLYNPAAPWPSKRDAEAILSDENGPRFRGYLLDAQRRPVFVYETAGVYVEETWLPEGDLKSGNARLRRLIRCVSQNPPASGPPTRLFLRAAAGNGLRESAPGVWEAPDGLRLRGEECELKPRPSPDGGGTELLVPFIFEGSSATVLISYEWING